MGELVRYDAARKALAEARKIDEVKEIKDKAEALRHYARQAQDKQMETWAAEIKLRAQRRLGEMSAKLEKAPGEGGHNRKALPNGGKSVKAATLKKAKVSTSEAHRCEQIASIPEEEFDEHIEKIKEKGNVPYAQQVVRQFAPKRKQKQVAKEYKDNTAALKKLDKYPVLYVDPPWQYEHGISLSRDIETKYGTMSFEQLKALKLPAADPSILYLWSTNSHLAQAITLMAHWGFSYRTNMVWVKPSIGPGYWVRSRHELLLIGIKGDMPVPIDKPDSVVEAKRLGHSAKPGVVRQLIEAAYPELPRIELFARGKHKGWDVWGNEA